MCPPQYGVSLGPCGMVWDQIQGRRQITLSGTVVAPLVSLLCRMAVPLDIKTFCRQYEMRDLKIPQSGEDIHPRVAASAFKPFDAVGVHVMFSERTADKKREREVRLSLETVEHRFFAFIDSDVHRGVLSISVISTMVDYWHGSVPPFPSDIPVAALQRIELRKLTVDDEAESQLLFNACQTSGFFLLDLGGLPLGEAMLGEVGKVFKLAKTLFDLDIDTKLKYAYKGEKAYGYKAVGAGKVDLKGNPDKNELWNIGKDGIWGVTEPQDGPDVLSASQTTLHSFVEHAHSICKTIWSHLDKSLNLKPGTLAALHNIDRPSTDLLRTIHVPPQPEHDRGMSLLSHTDIGTVTLLFNVLGGLQIQRPDACNGEDGWEFVKPQPGCAVVNVGDALVTFSNGILRSNLHRVTYPPGEQAFHDRYSLAFLCRPTDDARLTPLVDGGTPTAGEEKQKACTMREWAAERTKLYINGGVQMKSTGGVVGLSWEIL